MFWIRLVIVRAGASQFTCSVWTEPPSIWWWYCVLGLMWFCIAHKDKAALLRVQRKSEIVLEYVQTEALECRLARDRAFWASRRQCLDLGQLKSKRCACLDTKLRLLLRQEKSERYASLNDKLMQALWHTVNEPSVSYCMHFAALAHLTTSATSLILTHNVQRFTS